MISHRIRMSALMISGLLAIATAGCARSIAIDPPSLDPQSAAAQSVSNEDRVPLVMDTFHLSLNGAPQNPSRDLERRILASVQEARLFSTLVPLGEAPASLEGKAINARITFNETIDPHSGQTAFKGIVIGASMFLLSPLIELDYDYAVQASLELERWDGQMKRYEARSSGTVRYNLFGATPIMVEELKGRVTEACLAQLIDHLVRDTDLYLASSAPLTDSTIRTVTVKARTPTASGTMPVKIPTSGSPTP
jgi:hypothetical protein